MPARMWRHGIQTFLDLLRHRLSDLVERMLAFIYLAYSMMALLLEKVFSFDETWIECLGDLGRYRMAIEPETDPDRESWSQVARVWYIKAAKASPGIGRIKHHLALLARPNRFQQYFYYIQALMAEPWGESTSMTRMFKLISTFLRRSSRLPVNMVCDIEQKLLCMRSILCMTLFFCTTSAAPVSQNENGNDSPAWQLSAATWAGNFFIVLLGATFTIVASCLASATPTRSYGWLASIVGAMEALIFSDERTSPTVFFTTLAVGIWFTWKYGTSVFSDHVIMGRRHFEVIVGLSLGLDLIACRLANSASGNSDPSPLVQYLLPSAAMSIRAVEYIATHFHQPENSDLRALEDLRPGSDRPPVSDADDGGTSLEVDNTIRDRAQSGL